MAVTKVIQTEAMAGEREKFSNLSTMEVIQAKIQKQVFVHVSSVDVFSYISYVE